MEYQEVERAFQCSAAFSCFVLWERAGFSSISSLSITYHIMKLSYGKEIRGLLWQEVDSEDR